MSKNTRPLALISVTDKTGVLDFARSLESLNFEIISTGGTAKLLRDSGVAVTEVSTLTDCPEVLGGRVKTLHPSIHGGILADRSNPEHRAQLESMGWLPIDLVVVNLYNFAGEAKNKRLPLNDAIEFIDIGGPAMLRAAAKNHRSCLPVVDPSDYLDVIKRIKSNDLNVDYRRILSGKVFSLTAAYDQMIADYINSIDSSDDVTKQSGELPKIMDLRLTESQSLRYGENPHQVAGFYRSPFEDGGLADAETLQGKELSYNNYLDLDAASAIVAELYPAPAMTIIKHTNPCGTAAALPNDKTTSAKELFSRALMSDPKCAFGGIVASNIPIDESAALAMSEIFLECIIAPAYTEAALDIFRNKKNLRILRTTTLLTPNKSAPSRLMFKSISGGVLVQKNDSAPISPEAWSCVSKLKPNPTQLSEMAFAMSICKHVKSNAIVLSSRLQSIGIGAGQMSRIDSLHIAVNKSRELSHSLTGSVMASDAFFPFRDCVDLAAKAGITAIVQPGGSVRDLESIDAANEHGMIMMLTGVRHFKH
jgi:phosphoribosylaminoimidazolecarboxamide formyltransferase/IMP cyclohydrolase